MLGSISVSSGSISNLSVSASATDEDDGTNATRTTKRVFFVSHVFSDLVPSSDLVPVRKLGGGHFGEVWLMMWCKTTKVAVKWLKGLAMLLFNEWFLFNFVT